MSRGSRARSSCSAGTSSASTTSPGPRAFARLYPKLLDGYLLDALERLDGKPAPAERLEAFVESVLAAPRRLEASVGLGEDVRVSAKGLVGSGLELDGELLQLSAYSTS